MIKKYFNIIKKYFSLGANNTKLLIELFISVILHKSIIILTLPYFAAEIVKYATISDWNMTFASILHLSACYILYNLAYHWNFTSYAKISNFVHNDLQDKIMNKVSKFDSNFSKNITTSFIINTAFNDVGKVQQIPDILFTAIADVIGFILAIVIMIKVNICIGLISLVLSIVSFIIVIIQMEKRNYYLARQRVNQDEMVDLLGQLMEGNKEIKSFDMSDDLNKHLDKYKNLWSYNYMTKRFYQNRVFTNIPMILGLGKIVTYAILILLILNGKYEISVLIMIIGYYEEMQTKTSNLYSRLEEISSFSVRVERISRLLNYKTKNMLDFGKNINDSIFGNIEFNDVTFTYEKQTSLKNINFKIKHNSFTAIVGKSGSGKSTIFKLLLRLYKVNKGTITIDGINIYDYDQKVYTSNVSIVTQKPFIFDMTIKENLSLVDSNFENQVEACKRVGIHDFIMGLKDGYNTKLVNDAKNISIGEKQLIALARTLLSKSEILLFDEVTSSLDANTSKQIIKVIKNLKKDHTILMITHKPNLMKTADEIIVINEGKMVGKGKHDKLLKTNKYYRLLQK